MPYKDRDEANASSRRTEVTQQPRTPTTEERTMTERRAALTERWSGNGLSPMTAFEMAGAVYRDSRADAIEPDCADCPDTDPRHFEDLQVAAGDRRGLLNLVATLLDERAAYADVVQWAAQNRPVLPPGVPMTPELLAAIREDFAALPVSDRLREAGLMLVEALTDRPDALLPQAKP